MLPYQQVSYIFTLNKHSEYGQKIYCIGVCFAWNSSDSIDRIPFDLFYHNNEQDAGFQMVSYPGRLAFVYEISI